MGLERVVWTVGHSNHDLETFLGLLVPERITHVLDVRSYPYSRYAHFSREALQPVLKERGLAYYFVGIALGGRPRRDEHFDAEGHALYSEMAAEPDFRAAVDGLIRGAGAHRVALLCSCGRPDECHRRLLVGKVLCERGVTLRHIMPDGTVADEASVALAPPQVQNSLFGHDAPVWRSTRSVLHRRRLSASSAG
jgi:uncharacterized protein (DUF488 family)